MKSMNWPMFLKKIQLDQTRQADIVTHYGTSEKHTEAQKAGQT